MNRAHIPTPDMARQWPHLYHIAEKLLPMSECDVSLLVGYDCSRALLPREVIAPTNNGPYAQRTDLGWGIVGNVDPDQIGTCDFDPIGFSHRIMTFEAHQTVASHESCLF